MPGIPRRTFLQSVGLGLSGLTWQEQVARAAPAPGRKPNIVLLVTDDQRPDTIGALGNPHIRTPHLDALVRNGSAVTRAVSPNPICTPARAEILTGRSGFANGVLDFGGKIHAKLTTLPQALAAGGYSTWYVGKWHNNHRPTAHGYQHTRGLFSGGGGTWAKPQTDHHGRPVTGYRGWVFQSADGKAKYPDRGVGLTPDISAAFADAALDVIRGSRDRPFFLHVNFTAPHDPLLMPTGYAGRYDPAKIPLPPNFLREHPFDHGNFRGRDEKLLPWPRTPKDVREDLAVYYAVISHMDAQVGRIVAALQAAGQWDNTLLVFTSDQGLAVGSHGLRGKQNMYEHTIGVPMVFRGPGVPRGRRINAQMYIRDIYPTLCDLAGVALPKALRNPAPGAGRSLLPVLQGRAKTVHECVFGHFRDVQRMIRTDRWKLIHYPKIGRWQLFDLQADPRELRDLSGDARHAKTLAKLQDKLRAVRRQFGDIPKEPGE